MTAGTICQFHNDNNRPWDFSSAIFLPTNGEALMLSLEAIQAIAAQSPTLAFAIAMLMLLNRNYMDGLRERKEWLQQLAWLIERYDGQLTASVEAITNVRNEVHYLRGEISKLITPISVWIAKNTEPKHDDRS